MKKKCAQKALVTGGAGFIGSHLCERLKEEGYQVTSLDNYFVGLTKNHVDGVTYINGHTKDIDSLVTSKPDIVFHLGEYARVEKSFEDHDVVIDSNICGTAKIVEFCSVNKIRLLYAGSSTKFADKGVGINQSPYAFSKAKNTELIVNYGKWFNLDYCIVYFNNVYGPREPTGEYGTLIAICAELLAKNEPLLVNAPGTQRRNYTDIRDTVNGILLATEKGFGDGYAISSHKSYSVLEVAEMFGLETVMVGEKAGNRMESMIDTSKLEALGWKAKYRLVDYVKKVKQTTLS